MKKSTLKRILIFMTVFFSSICFMNATSPVSDMYSFYLYKVNSSEDPISPENPDKRQRSHPIAIECHISVYDGVQISGIETNEISAFEIWDPQDFCIASYSNEQDFLSDLVMLRGEYQLRFITENFCLYGWICIE